MILKGLALNFLELLQQPISFLIFTKTHIFRRIVNNNTEENSKITLTFRILNNVPEDNLISFILRF